MVKTEISTPADTSVSRPRDVFAAMRDEMDRVFERFETDWPHWPRLSAWPRWPGAFRRVTGAELVVPDLDARENGNSVVIEAELPGVEEKDVSVTLANSLLHQGREEGPARGEGRDPLLLRAELWRIRALPAAP
jgi:HSP20 family molecular chaperone IbpA